MGLIKKLKDILFDEEEYTEQIKITPEMRNEATPTKDHEEMKIATPVSEKSVKKPMEKEEKNFSEVPKQQAKEVPTRTTVSNNNMSERELFKSEKTFPFVDFDEDKFDKEVVPTRLTSSVSLSKSAEPKRSTNVFEYERRKKSEKRNEFGRLEKMESSEVIDKKKFKPSPIISPVYGVLNKDYQKEDIVQKSDVKDINIKEVREKAFGEKKSITKPVEEKTNYYEEEKTVTIPPLAEKERKVKTIDELLEDTSDVVVDIDSDLDNDVQDILPRLDKKTNLKKDYEDTKEMKLPENDDKTLENDLFDLIDSMYNNKEDGE